MGVHGLWKLLEAAGKPVPLETLENKVLAVDVSIWLHQLMKGFQDSRGAPLPNAHLLGLFHRVCKLLFYRIKPVFIFDGGVPLLKRQTIAARKKQKNQASQNAADAKEKLLKNLVKRKAVRQILQGPQDTTDNHETVPKDDMFHLPPLPVVGIDSDSEDEVQDRLQGFMEDTGSGSESEPEIKPKPHFLAHKLDLHTLDVHSEEFRSLPPDVRHDILSELKETRKQNSWGKLHEMPEESGDFSNFQLGRLMKRRNVQCAMEQAEKEMGGKVMRMNELLELMTAQGVQIIEDSTTIASTSQRIASDAVTRFVLCKDSSSKGQSSQSSHSSLGEVKEEQDNLLLNEQTEFIAKMAENMLKQMEKKKHDKNIVKTEPAVNVVSDEEHSLHDNNAKEKILADNWSSDEEEIAITQQSSKLLSQVSPKRKLSDRSEDSDSDVSPVSKIAKLGTDIAVACSSKDTHHREPISNDNTDEEVCQREKATESSSSDCDDLVEPVTTSLLDCAEVGVNVQELESQRKSEISQGNVKKAFEPKKSIEMVLQSEKKCDEPKLSQSEEEKNSSTNKIESLEIVIKPGGKQDVDDIFADIFQVNTNKVHISKEDEKSSRSGVKPLEIVIKPEENPDDDDIFADIFQSHPKILTSMKEEISSDSEPEVLHGSPPITRRDVESSEAEEENEGDQSEIKGQKSEAKSDNPTISSLFLNAASSSTDWNEMQASLEAEQIDLQRERGRQERLAASITDQMCNEAQELLQLFGLPYMVAPMEAEAQCAFLDAISLTEGSITDDSDIWLFGGKKVYKNFFNQKKHVLQFTSSNINQYFKLSREQLVQLALLVGSDYTTGIQGIGPVTALEILAAFHSKLEADPIQNALRGLGQFREWWNSGKPHRTSQMRRLDKKLKNVKFAEGFPSQAVVEAYLRPSVDDSQDTFSWGTLDLPALREYARSKFGWTASKSDEILLPVAKRWTARSSQRSIDSYFNFQPKLVEGLSKMSKRVQQAVTLMDDDADSEDVDNPDPVPTAKTKPRKKPQAPSSKDSKVQTKTNKQNSSERKGRSQGPKVQQTSKKTIPNMETASLPRQRTSSGIKRVGLKPSEIESHGVSDSSENQVKTGGSESLEKKKQVTHTVVIKTPSDQLSPGSESHLIVQNLTRNVQVRRKVQIKKSHDAPGNASKSIEEESPAGGSGRSEPAEEEPLPSTSRDGADLSFDFAGLSEMNWEDDPWAAEVVEERRPKVFFGGIRPNKPRKPARRQPVQPQPPENADSRGVRPGWATRERLESRTAWVDSMQRKKEEAIPQRQLDQRAMEDAKSKAIAVIKATEAKQASRLLGRSTKRGRGKAKPIRKVLPDHNLSESSSDE